MQVHSSLVCGAAALSFVMALVQPAGAQSKPRIVIVATGGTFGASSTCLPVTGFLPLLASVAAIVARSFALTPIEH